MIAITAAPPITQTLYTLVIAITPIFSPYVVLGGAPNKPATEVATPSPSMERCRPVLGKVPSADAVCDLYVNYMLGYCDICNRAIASMADRLNSGYVNWGMKTCLPQ
jgi:hypothetical protein